MINITLKIISSVFLICCFVGHSHAQELDAAESEFLKRYLSLTPIKRVSVFQNEAAGNVTNFFLMSKDLNGITGIDAYKHGSIAIGGVLGATYIANDSMFALIIDSLKKKVATNAFLKASNRQDLTGTDTTANRIISSYLKNSLVERIAFIELHFKKIPADLLKLMQTDIDAILRTNTSNISCSEKCFLKAKKKWLTILAKT
jgi:hypothetical protein